MKILLLALAAAAATGCSNFAQPFGNIEPDVKTRPLSVILEPCCAAPGDTVTVTAYVYTPETAISFSWAAKLDYFETGYGFSGVTPRAVDLDEIPGTMSTSAPDPDGLVTHTFKFRVPENALAASALLPPAVDVRPYDAATRTLLGIPAGVSTISNAMFDSLLAANAVALNSLPVPVPPEVMLGIDTYATGMFLEATVSCEIGLVLERTLAISYSGRYQTYNYNRNPVIRDISIISMDKDEVVTSLDDLAGIAYDSVLLYSTATPVTEPESVLIDINRKYYVTYTHDTEQEFYYISVNDNSVQTAEETYDHDWCYSNLDPSAQVQDSLAIVSGNTLIPPRDTDMHNFRLYLLMHDYRSEWGKAQGTGTAFAEVYGYFKYTDAYKAEH